MTQTNIEAVTGTWLIKFLCNFTYFLKVYNNIQGYSCYNSNIDPPYCTVPLVLFGLILLHVLFEQSLRETLFNPGVLILFVTVAAELHQFFAAPGKKWSFQIACQNFVVQKLKQNARKYTG
jgi:hypothetical protein